MRDPKANSPTTGSRAVADYVVIHANGSIATGVAHHTPDDVDDRTAATLWIAGSTAAALAILNLGPTDTVLVGGAGGGVGVFAVQLARIVGVWVIGTGSLSLPRWTCTAPRCRSSVNWESRMVVFARLSRWSAASRLRTAPTPGPNVPREIARLVAAGTLRVPIAAAFPIEDIRAAVERQAGWHVSGKVVIDL